MSIPIQSGLIFIRTRVKKWVAMGKINTLSTPTIDKSRRLDWSSLNLLMTLSLPALLMAVILLLWPDVTWQAETLHTAIVLTGSAAALMLSIFAVIRYRGKPGIQYLCSGLLAAGILGGFQSLTTPGSSEYVWFYVSSGVFSSLCFLIYIAQQFNPKPWSEREILRARLVVLGASASVILFAVLSLIMNNRLPLMADGIVPTRLAWIMNSFSLAVYLVSAIYMFFRYRLTGNGELVLFTAVSLFLFQASEVFYFAKIWSVVWWFWLMLRLVIYISVFVYLLKEYVEINDNLRTEIHKRVIKEGELRQAEYDWRRSFDSLEEAMFILDQDCRIVNSNDAAQRLLGNSDKQASVNCISLLFGQTQCSKNCPCQTAMLTGRISQDKRESNGRHYNIKVSPILGNSTEAGKFVYLVNDITDQVQSEEKEKLLQRELSQRSRLASIGEVVAGVTHEINNPLTGVIAFAQLLRRADVPENMKEAVDVINEGTLRVAEIVDKLHTFSRRQRPDKEYSDINSIISGVLQIRSYEFRKHNIEIVSLLESVPRTMFNTGQLQQVLLNIIVNAEQAISQFSKAGAITVSSSIVGNLIKVSVRDSGPGIKEENLEKLFTPFFTTKDVNGGPGLGLGLSISYGIIKEHGGRIYAENCQGGGAAFTFELPVLSEPELVCEDVDFKTKGETVSKIKVLVIDDELHIRRALERVLAGEGHEVQTTGSAQNALETVKTTDFDLIVLDIKMPGIDGISFYEQLVARQPEYRSKVICMTGDLVSSRNKDFIKKENIPYLIKPFGIEELLEKVNSVIRSIQHA